MSPVALLILVAFQFIGELIVNFAGIPIPGAIVGLLLLLLAMFARPSVFATVEGTSWGILQNLSLLFIPAGAGIIVSWRVVGDELFAIVVATVVSTTLSILATALVTRWLMNLSKKRAAAAPGDAK